MKDVILPFTIPSKKVLWIYTVFETWECATIIFSSGTSRFLFPQPTAIVSSSIYHSLFRGFNMSNINGPLEHLLAVFTLVMAKDFVFSVPLCAFLLIHLEGRNLEYPCSESFWSCGYAWPCHILFSRLAYNFICLQILLIIWRIVLYIREVFWQIGS